MTSDTALIETPDSYTAPSSLGPRRLSQAELGIMLCLHRDGKSQVAIAEHFGVSQPAISQALARLGVDTTDLAKHRAKASAYSRVKRLDTWSKTRDAIGMKAHQELNQIAELTGTGDSKGVNVAVQVLIGMPDQPVGPDPFTLGQGESGHET